MNQQPFRLGTGGDWGFRGTGVLGVGTGDRGLIHGDVLQWTNNPLGGAQASRISGHKRRRNPESCVFLPFLNFNDFKKEKNKIEAIKKHLKITAFLK